MVVDTMIFGGVGRLAAMLLAMSMAGAAVPARSNSAQTQGSVLQQRYDAAQRFQASHQLDQAAQQYRIFIADALGEIAMGQARAGEYERAATYFDESLRLVPEFPAMQLEYARAALRNGNLEHARLLAEGVLRGDPKNKRFAAQAHAVLGSVLLKMNKDADGKEQIEAAVELDPSFENGYELGVADLDLGDGEGAAKVFAEMKASFGDTAVLHMYFGNAYGNSDFQAKAVDEFKQAIAKDDKLPGVHYALAAAYLATEGNAKLPEALAEIRREITNTPTDAAAYAALGHLLVSDHASSVDAAEAEKDMQHATQLDPANPDAFLYLGQFYAQQKRTAEAEFALRQSILLTRDASRNAYQVQKAHYLLGRLLMQEGKSDEGQKEIEMSQALLQQNLSRDRAQLSDYLQEKSGMANEATTLNVPMTVQDKPADSGLSSQVDALEKKLGPAIADSYNNLGAIAGTENDNRSALVSFERAEEWNAALPGLDYNLGRAAFATGEFAEAVGPLNRYLQEHPSEDGARLTLGLCQYMLADYVDAVKTLQPLDSASGGSTQVRLAYAKSLVETDAVADGEKRLVALEAAEPSSSAIHCALGEAYAKENSAKAGAELNEAVRLDAQNAEAQVALGRWQLQHGDVKDAVQHLSVAAKLRPNDAALQRESAEATKRAAGAKL
jgi:tetratricopeptide (TPR) repeat protein